MLVVKVNLINLMLSKSVIVQLILDSLAIQTEVYEGYCLSTVLCWALAAFSVSWSFAQSVGLLGRGISQSQGRYLHTGQHKRRINAHRHQCLKWYSNPRSQCFERAKTVHAFDRAATFIGMKESKFHKFILLKYVSTAFQCGKWISIKPSTCLRQGWNLKTHVWLSCIVISFPT
jgi:hypothetical protein